MITCPYCNSTEVRKDGNRRLLNGWKQTYECKKCGKRHTPEKEKEEYEVKTGPSVLFLDIETAPMVVFSFQLKTDYIQPDKIITPTFALCWAAKWAGDNTVLGDVLTSKEARNQDDSRICKSIHRLLCKADLVVAFNGDRFDFQKLNYRFIVNGLQPPSEYRTIDPIVTLRNRFGFDSNQLDFTNGLLGLERKTHTEFSMWKDCYYGDKTALENMLKYNMNDVHILEKHYMKLRPFMKNHPNMGVYYEEFEGEMCRICGSKEVKEVLDKFHYTNLGKYSLYRCSDCGAESTGRHNELSKEKRKELLK